MLYSDCPRRLGPESFQTVVGLAEKFLNMDCNERPDYYKKRGGTALEDDVLAALLKAAEGGPFGGKIRKVSGQRFPDLVAAGGFGVEVKSTVSNSWQSTGSSILESTRVDGVRNVWMAFGKLGGAPLFRIRPYEECLSDIVVTHMPRYLINMLQREGETIFDEMGISYDKLRTMKEPARAVAAYYRRKKPGEYVWWAGGDMSPTFRAWGSDAVTKEERRAMTVYALTVFPEVIKGVYENYALWLQADRGVINPNVRDAFSAGGKEPFTTTEGEAVELPAVFRRLRTYYGEIRERLAADDPTEFRYRPSLQFARAESRLAAWERAVVERADVREDITEDFLAFLRRQYGK